MTDQPVADWASTRADEYDMHRFGADQRARCDPAIRTNSSSLGPERDVILWPYQRLRTRQEIEDSGFAHRYRFCTVCACMEEGEPS